MKRDCCLLNGHSALFIVFLLAVVGTQSACSQLPPPPASGIRVHAFIIQGPGILGATINGQDTQDLGPGTGYQLSIFGETDLNGLADFPNAKTNAVWNIQVYFSTSNWFSCLAAQSGPITIPNGKLLDFEVGCQP